MRGDSSVRQNPSIGFEIGRKLMHVATGLLIAYLIYAGLLTFRISFALLSVGIILSYISSRNDVPLLRLFLARFDRKEHKKTPALGVLTLFLAVTLILLMYELKILSLTMVLASILIWTFGDSVAGVVGRLFGKIKNPFSSRSVEGTIAGIIAGTLAAWTIIPFYVAFAACVIAMLVESIELQIFGWRIDDNFTIIIVAAAVLYLIL